MLTHITISIDPRRKVITKELNIIEENINIVLSDLKRIEIKLLEYKNPYIKWETPVKYHESYQGYNSVNNPFFYR